LEPGDIITFDASRLWHSLVAPEESTESESESEAAGNNHPQKIHACISLYTNGAMLKEVRKANAPDKLPSEELSSEEFARLSVYERERLKRKDHNALLIQALFQVKRVSDICSVY